MNELNMFSFTGVFLANGPDWQSLRSKVQQDMMRPQSAFFYTDKLQVPLILTLSKVLI